MPCNVVYDVVTEQITDLVALEMAAKELGFHMSKNGEEYYIAGTIRVKGTGGKYSLTTTNRGMMQQLMDEYAAARVTKEARRNSWQVQKQKEPNGKIKLRIFQE